MSIQLRRGTNAERTLITPAEGELIYTTDTKVLWVGDNATPGGVRVSNLSGEVTDPTYNSITLNPSLGNAIIRNTRANSDIIFRVRIGTVEQVAARIDGATGNISTANSVVAANVQTANVISDHLKLPTNISSNAAQYGDILYIDNGLTVDKNCTVRVAALNGKPSYTTRYVDTGTPADSTTTMGVLQFEYLPPGSPTVSIRNYIISRKDDITIRQISTANTFPDTHIIRLTKDGRVGIGVAAPTSALHVGGDIMANGHVEALGYIQAGAFGNTRRAGLTPVNGMIIYNSTVNRFQGYQNGHWINLDDGSLAP